MTHGVPEKAHVASGDHLMRLTVDEARELVLNRVSSLKRTETVGLAQLQGRVLAESLRSTVLLPRYDHAAMDGIAFNFAAWDTSGNSGMPRSETVFAGVGMPAELASDACAAIMTGAPVPKGADTVVPRENLSERDGLVFVDGTCRQGQHIRRAGEDIAPGDELFSAGRRLGAADVGVIASIGLTEAQVFARPKMLFFSTGDELVEPGEKVEYGQLIDSNRFSIGGLARRMGCEVTHYQPVIDDPAVLAEALLRATAEADIVVTSGGVSAGDADYVTPAIQRLGRLHFWKVLMKPGLPVAFGEIQNTPCFGLPGNPVSGMATLMQIVRPAILRLAGEQYWAPLSMRARASMTFTKRHPRQEFVRAQLSWDERGVCCVESVGSQSSGRLHSMSLANCFVRLPAGPVTINPGDEVLVEPFAGYFPE